MTLSPQMNLENKQILSQTQIQSLKILTMDTLTLDNYLKEEYLNNPLLEYTPNHDIGVSSEVEYKNSSYDHLIAGKNDERGRESYYENYLADEKFESLKEHLLSQLPTNSFSKEEWELILYLMECLEEDGYLRMEQEEISRLTGKKEEMIDEILDILKDLEPYGIFAKDLSECLMRQLKMRGIENPILDEIIKSHLSDVAAGRISVISRKFGISTAEVRKYIAILATLNPKPLSGFQDEKVNYIIPDIILSRKEGVWQIKINDNCFGTCSVNEHYLHMMKKTEDKELREYFRERLEKCRFILSGIEQRRKTIESMMGIVLERQGAYFDGTGYIKPLTMAEVASKLDVHPSTVTRAVKGKYVQYPKGTILLKDLFVVSVTTNEQGDGVSSDCVKDFIKEFIHKEDKRKPYSDAKLVELLEGKGIYVSRRVVAKYRDDLFIKSSFARKKL